MHQLEVNGRLVVVKGHLLRVAKLDADKYHFIEDPTDILNGLRNGPTRVDIFSFLSKLSDPPFPLLSYPMEWDNLAVLQLSSFDNWWNNQIRFEARNRAKQAAKKGLTIREVPFSEELVRGIWEIYNECPIRQGRPFPHYRKPLEIVHREAATYLDWSIFIGAFQDAKLVGFAKLVTDERRSQANFMNILSMMAHRDKAPTNAILAQAVRSCAARDCQYLVYQNFVYGNKPPDTLSKFKEVNGFRRVEVPRYFVPVSPLGNVAVQLGFHRRLADRLPSAAAARLRKLRELWYYRKTQPSPRSA